MDATEGIVTTRLEHFKHKIEVFHEKKAISFFGSMVAWISLILFFFYHQS